MVMQLTQDKLSWTQNERKRGGCGKELVEGRRHHIRSGDEVESGHGTGEVRMNSIQSLSYQGTNSNKTYFKKERERSNGNGTPPQLQLHKTMQSFLGSVTLPARPLPTGHLPQGHLPSP